MNAYDSLYAALTADAALAAIIPSDRIQRHYLRLETPLPAISYKRSATAYDQTIHGTVLAATPSFAIVCVAETEAQVESIGDAVEKVSGLRLMDREDEFDVDKQLYATVVTVEVFFNL